MTTAETSHQARIQFESTGDKQRHYKIILDTLKLAPCPLSSWGISKRSTLTYIQAARRMSELKRLGLIKEAGKITEKGSTRTTYSL